MRYGAAWSVTASRCGSTAMPWSAEPSAKVSVTVRDDGRKAAEEN